ncbi:PUA-like domain-containing protein [Gautieria morchelliformis]|nr:PUA-like domain-containing protein [Gautieria morchelliformis]
MATESRDASPVPFYLMKAEPDSRIVKGKDVKFSVDDFESAQNTAWEGVRNYEARNIMQGMKVGDKVLFYHSNTKNPGVAAYAEVSKEAYPDHTAWDKTHPYYDAKSDAASPKWHMVELRFVSRVPHFIPLALLRHLSTLSEAPAEMNYLNSNDLKGIRDMALLNKGRLSVQRVEKEAWAALSKIACEGYGDIDFRPQNKAKKVAKGKGRRAARSTKDETHVSESDEGNSDAGATTDKRKRKNVATEAVKEPVETRKSKRMKN